MSKKTAEDEAVIEFATLMYKQGNVITAENCSLVRKIISIYQQKLDEMPKLITPEEEELRRRKEIMEACGFIGLMDKPKKMTISLI